MKNGVKPKLVAVNGEGVTQELMPSFKVRQRVPRPTTAKKALGEAGSLYAAARRGEIPIGDATRLAYVLKTCSELAEAADVEPRIDALEARIAALARKLTL